LMPSAPSLVLRLGVMQNVSVRRVADDVTWARIAGEGHIQSGRSMANGLVDSPPAGG
jgi:hypothetical protein